MLVVTYIKENGVKVVARNCTECFDVTFKGAGESSLCDSCLTKWANK